MIMPEPTSSNLKKIPTTKDSSVERWSFAVFILAMIFGGIYVLFVMRMGA